MFRLSRDKCSTGPDLARLDISSFRTSSSHFLTSPYQGQVPYLTDTKEPVMPSTTIDMPFLAPLKTSSLDLMDPRLLINTPPATPPKSQASSDTVSIARREKEALQQTDSIMKVIPRGEYIEDVDEEGSQPPELTEVSTAATMRLAHRVLELHDVVGMWTDFRQLGTNGVESDYLNRCYISEVFSSWRILQRQYHDVTWLRENGNGTRKATRLEKELAKLMDRIGEWRNKNMPRQSRQPYNRRSWHAEWRTAGAIGSSGCVPGINEASSCSRYSSGSNSVESSISNGQSSHVGSTGGRCSTICETSPLTAPASPLLSPPSLPPIVSTKYEDWWTPSNGTTGSGVTGNSGNNINKGRDNGRSPTPLHFASHQKPNPHQSHLQQQQPSSAPAFQPSMPNTRPPFAAPSYSSPRTQTPLLQSLANCPTDKDFPQQHHRSRALGLAEMIVRTLRELQLSRSHIDKDIELIRKQLLLSQFHWLERQVEKRRAGLNGSGGSSSSSSSNEYQVAVR